MRIHKLSLCVINYHIVVVTSGEFNMTLVMAHFIFVVCLIIGPVVAFPLALLHFIPIMKSVR